MKKRLLLFIVFTFLGLNAFAVKHFIFNITNSFSPASLQINLGDTVIFALTSQHNARQVSQTDWNNNDTILMPGGFDFPYGSQDTLIPTTLGDIYYVCVPHVEMHGMKGMIKVSQVGIEAIKPLNFQILQSISEQRVELVVSGGSACEMHVEMLNLSGQTVRKINMELNGDEASAIIEVGDLPKGVYMIRWSYGNVNKARKIILQ